MIIGDQQLNLTAVFGVGGVIEGLTLGDLLVFFTGCEKSLFWALTLLSACTLIAWILL